MIPERLIDLDRAVTLAINSLHSPATDQFWMLMSDSSIWFPAYLIVAVFMFRRLGTRRGLIVLLSIVLTIIFCDQVSGLIKDSVERLRPCYDALMLTDGLRSLEIRKGYFGFFSGHASNAFGFITCTWLGLRNDKTAKYRGFAAAGYLWAVLVSLSRVMVGKHFFGDILIGTVFGILTGYLFGKLATLVIRKYAKEAE